MKAVKIIGGIALILIAVVGIGGPRRSVATPGDVGRHDEIPVRVEGSAGSEHAGPPLIGIGRSGEGMADQDRRRSGPPPGPVGDPDPIQCPSSCQRERSFDIEELCVFRDRVVHAVAPSSPALANAVSKSALMSSMCSIPTDTRIWSSVTPAANCSAASIC